MYVDSLSLYGVELIPLFYSSAGLIQWLDSKEDSVEKGETLASTTLSRLSRLTLLVVSQVDSISPLIFCDNKGVAPLQYDSHKPYTFLYGENITQTPDGGHYIKYLTSMPLHCQGIKNKESLRKYHIQEEPVLQRHDNQK